MTQEQQVVYISGQEAARRLGCASITVSRVARKHRIGVIVEDGRLAALSESDLTRLRPLIHQSRGNPDWIAAGVARKKRQPRRTKAT
jgi:hypothetical protein